MADSPLEAGPALPAEASNASTLYPKISGKLIDLAEGVNDFLTSRAGGVLQELPFTGTVKLHGTHADILVHDDGSIVCQSRNQTRLTPGKTDNAGFAAFVSKNQEAILSLATRVRACWAALHPGQNLPTSEPLIIAGEWIGTGIMKGVAVAQLSRRFVLCSVHLASAWQPIQLYSDIADEKMGLFNIGMGGFFHLYFDARDRGEAFMQEAKRLTLEVGAACPFGRALGVEGPGEGIVWTPAADSVLPNVPHLWLKTKSETFAVTAYHKFDPLAANNDKQEQAKRFAEATATPVRLQQGWDYLSEMGIKQDKTATGRFMAWLMQDIQTEEKREIEALAAGTPWKKEVNRIATQWYKEKLAGASILS